MSAESPQNSDAQVWDLPLVDDAKPIDKDKTNAYNKPFGKWKYEAPEEEQELAPLTAQDIEAIRSSAFEEGFEQGKQEGFAKGHEEGLLAGKQEGLALGKEEGAAQSKAETDAAAKVHLDALATLVEQMQNPLEQLNNEVKQELLMLSISMAQAVLKVEVKQSSDSLIKIINESIAALPMQETQYQLLLHADDITALHEHMGEEALKQQNWQLVPSAEMERGGCKLISQNNAVDMSISRRCEHIFNQVLLDQGLSNDPRAS